MQTQVINYTFYTTSGEKYAGCAMLMMHQDDEGKFVLLGADLDKWTSTLVTYVILHDFTGAKVFLHYSQLVKLIRRERLRQRWFYQPREMFYFRNDLNDPTPNFLRF